MKGLPDEFVGTVLPLGSASNITAFGYLGIKAREDGIVLKDFLTYSAAKQKRIIKFGDWQSLDGMNHGDGFGFGEAWDTEPDEFYFNFGKHSGRFVFDQDGNINFLPNQNFKITKNIQPVNVNGANIPKIVERKRCKKRIKSIF